MTGSRHDRGLVEAFLDDEFRQVWAAERSTGEPRFLPDGEAADLRAIAKAEWRCPVPDCEVEITTVGGTSRRHHFRHNQPSPHASDGESEFHLAAKAMIAAWAEARVPTNASVKEERWTTKHPDTSRYRIADVMVTWETGHQTAFEVEYKNYAPEDWETKQSDYDNHDPNPIACAWLLGHLRLKRPPRGSHLADDPSIVRIPLLGQEWNKAGRPLLVINPVTRQIGTITSQHEGPYGPESPEEEDTYGRLYVDALDDCELDTERGIVTPTMRRIDVALARRRTAEEKRRRADETARQQRLAQEQEAQRRRDEKQQRNSLFAQRNAQRWNASPLKDIAAMRWGSHVPDILTDSSGEWWWIHAEPLHWHLALYENCIHDRPIGTTFTINDCWSALAAHQIQTNNSRSNRFKALVAFLEALTRVSLISIERQQSGLISHLQIDATLDDLERIRHERAERAKKTQAAREAADAESRRVKAVLQQQRREQKKERTERLEADSARDWQAQKQRLADIDARKAEHEKHWIDSDIHRDVAAVHGGEIPPAIKWPGGEHLAAIHATPAHWHAHIYMTHVHGQPTGNQVTPETARKTLEAADINLDENTQSVLTAIDAYLYNLTQRGILRVPTDGQRSYVLA
ncbi:hypothetical protein NOK12_33940 [Nocardioides sp. OK12]|uniref:competence protein CoiA family protein n=1 Tax=Nocardioides sp. OK12 TaxID=2758661 RepID=UPI0021C2E167|nr:competence protein CoiA family protein [Nocardioides sp. OK12]GHJ60876.1 hypothetical protein NOK12_33940 [Nocardioides sp. OK12]